MSFRTVCTVLLKTAWVLVLCLSASCVMNLEKGGSGGFFAVNNRIFDAEAESNEIQVLSLKQLELCKKLGISWQRLPMPWEQIEPRHGVFKWNFSDQMVNGIIAMDQDILAVLGPPSPWSESFPPSTPSERERFGHYVAETVKRYQDGIKAWELWDEPNTETSWSPHPDASLYAELLKTSYLAAKKADPHCLIVAPALAGLDLCYLESLYQHKANEYFDVLSYHYKPNHPDPRYLQWEIIDLHYLLKRFGDDAKTIWITNLGTPFTSKGSSFDEASWLVKAYIMAASSRRVERIFMEPLSTPGNPQGFNLSDEDLNLNPSGIAFRNMTRLLGDLQYHGPLAISPDVQAFLFIKGRKAIAVLWSSHGKQTINLPCNRKLSLIDVSGIEKNLNPENGIIRFSVSENPLYLEGSKGDFKLASGFRLEPEVMHLIPGGSGELFINLENPYKDKEISGRIIFSAHPGVTIEPGEFPFHLSKGEILRKSVPLNVSNQAYPDFYPLMARAILESPLHHEFTANGILRVTPPFRVCIGGRQKDGKFSVETKLVNLCTENLSGSIKWKLRPRGKVEAPPLFFTDLRPNDEITTVSGLMAGNKEAYLVSATTLESGYQMEEFIGLMSMPLRMIGPRLDGNLQEWVDVPKVHLDKKFHLTYTSPGIEWTKSDASGVFQFWLTDQALYLAADIMDDDSLVNPNRGSEILNGDCIELFLGLDGPVERNWYGDFSFHLGINPGHKGRLPHMWNWTSQTPVEKANIVTLRKETGYIIEARIPFSELSGWKPERYSMIGFDVALCDLDNGRGSTPGVTLNWSGRAESRRDPSSWGLAIIH